VAPAGGDDPVRVGPGLAAQPVQHGQEVDGPLGAAQPQARADGELGGRAAYAARGEGIDDHGRVAGIAGDLGIARLHGQDAAAAVHLQHDREGARSVGLEDGQMPGEACGVGFQVEGEGQTPDQPGDRTRQRSPLADRAAQAALAPEALKPLKRAR
jgi:hypothetical protein